MNNIGGIIHCEILSSDDLLRFSVQNRTAIFRLKESAHWTTLPISVKQTTATATPTTGDAGTLYNHQVNALLPAFKADALLLSLCNDLCRSGCIIRYTDANGNRRILGTKDYPLTGTLEEVPGNSAISLAGYKLSLKASEQTPQLTEV